jgi:hypothetical protein
MGMKTKNKTWAEKLANGKEPVVGASSRSIGGFPPGSMMLIPTPRQVDDYIRRIPKGKSKTQQEMSIELAAEADADLTCPMCCGLFIRIVAEAAHEAMLAGRPNITPFWRIIPPEATIRKKLSFVPLVDKLREEEGLPV